MVARAATWRNRVNWSQVLPARSAAGDHNASSSRHSAETDAAWWWRFRDPGSAPAPDGARIYWARSARECFSVRGHNASSCRRGPLRVESRRALLGPWMRMAPGFGPDQWTGPPPIGRRDRRLPPRLARCRQSAYRPAAKSGRGSVRRNDDSPMRNGRLEGTARAAVAVEATLPALARCQFRYQTPWSTTGEGDQTSRP